MSMAVDVEVTALAVDYDTDDDLVHLVCTCNPDIALCGAKIPGDCWIDDGCDIERDCVVCLDLNDKPCGRCGRTDA